MSTLHLLLPFSSSSLSFLNIVIRPIHFTGYTAPSNPLYNHYFFSKIALWDLDAAYGPLHLVVQKIWVLLLVPFAFLYCFMYKLFCEETFFSGVLIFDVIHRLPYFLPVWSAVIPGVICQFFNHNIHCLISVAWSFSCVVINAFSLSDCSRFKIFSHADYVLLCV